MSRSEQVPQNERPSENSGTVVPFPGPSLQQRAHQWKPPKIDHGPVEAAAKNRKDFLAHSQIVGEVTEALAGASDELCAWIRENRERGASHLLIGSYGRISEDGQLKPKIEYPYEIGPLARIVESAFRNSDRSPRIVAEAIRDAFGAWLIRNAAKLGTEVQLIDGKDLSQADFQALAEPRPAPGSIFISWRMPKK